MTWKKKKRETIFKEAFVWVLDGTLEPAHWTLEYSSTEWALDFIYGHSSIICFFEHPFYALSDERLIAPS